MHPVNAPITQVFGANPQFAWQLGYGHLGIDYGCSQGSSVVSIAPGTILWADWGQKMPYAFAVENAFIPGSGNSGICVVIQHDGWRSIEAHLSSTHLNPGDRVGRGQEVGKSGTTGNSTGPHLHYEVYVLGNPSSPPFGRYNPIPQIEQEDREAGSSAPAPTPAAPKPAAPAQKTWKVGSGGAKQRKLPRLDSPVVRTVEGGKDETFSSWSVGQFGPGGTNIWFRDGDGFIHASAFESQDRQGLPETKVAWLGPQDREVGEFKLNQRSFPYTDARVIREIDPRTIEKFNKWCQGTSVNGSDVWFGDDAGWVHCSGFDTQQTDNLTKVAAPQYPATPAPAPTTPVPVKPQPTDYTFAKAFPMVTEVRPAAPGNFEKGNFPAAKDVLSIFIHQFNADEVADNATVNKVTVHLDSVVNTFQGTGRVASAHFGVEGTRVVQFLALTDRAYAQGSPGNGEGWSIETYGAQDAATMATVALLIRELEKLGGKKQLRKHKDVMATKCGNGVDIAKYRQMVDALDAPPAPTPVPVPVPVPSGSDSLLKQIEKMIGDFFAGRK